MTIRYCGPGGNNGNSGLTWALRKLTLNGVEDTPVVVGDVVYVGPGVYRERFRTDVPGGNTYSVGTVTVTNESTTVTGAGTAFLANVGADYFLHIRFFASGADGVANGTATFTSAAGNFQANMVGRVIQINARAPYTIGAVAAANSITLVDVHGVGWPAAGGGLTYSVMSGEGSYDIASVTNDTTLELKRPWSAPTMTGLAYITYEPIRYIADVTGEHTDGVGGPVRVTGSNNDQTAVQVTVMQVEDDYRYFSGFHLDLGVFDLFYVLNSYTTIEDCALRDSTEQAIYFAGALICNTVRRCYFFSTWNPVKIEHTADVDDSGDVVENCFMIGSAYFHILVGNVGGVTVKNCNLIGCGGNAVQVGAPSTVGQTTDVRNCMLTASDVGMRGTAIGDITEDYNLLCDDGTDRVNTAVGANSVAWGSLYELPILHPGFKFPWWAGELSEWAQVAAKVGEEPPRHDLRGFVKPVTAAKRSWGALQFTDAERDTGTVYAGVASLVLADAGRIQFRVPCTNRSYVVRARVQREANYAGTNPQIVIKQPGQADRTTTDGGGASAWNLLEDTFTPAADPEYFFVELVSSNTAAAGNYATYFDNLEVRGEPQEPGEFEHWLWDRQPFDTLPANALVVSGREYRRRRMPGEVSAMEEQ